MNSIFDTDANINAQVVDMLESCNETRDPEQTLRSIFKAWTANARSWPESYLHHTAFMRETLAELRRHGRERLADTLALYVMGVPENWELKMARMNAVRNNRKRRWQAQGVYTTALHVEYREYGGPEEGGWYYDAGHPEAAVKTFDNKADADAYARRLQRIAQRLNRHRRPAWSVACEGVYVAVTQIGPHAHAWPEKRPHYE